jgi:hypothetical protein
VVAGSSTEGYPEKSTFGHTLDGYNFGDIGDFLLNNPLDTRFQRHLAHGAAMAGPGQPHFDYGTIDIYQLYTPAVFLQHWSYLGKRLLHLLTHLFPPVKIIVKKESRRAK